MTVAIDKTVRELALENPASTRVFEKLGIDYCCGGNRSLREACQSADLQLDQVCVRETSSNSSTTSIRWTSFAGLPSR